MTGQPLRLGVVGVGTMGALYAHLAREHPFVDLVGIADANHERAATAAARFDTRAYTSIETLLADARPSAVAIATPDFAHRQPFLAAAAAGAHVLLEKPLAMDLGEAQEMAGAARQAGIRCQLAFTNRWTPAFAAARAAIADGQTGLLVSLQVRQNNSIATPTRGLAWAGRTGPHWFLLSHAFDLARWLAGEEVVEVTARAVKRVLVERGIDTYDCVQVLAVFASGAVATFESNWILPEGMPLNYDLSFEIVGERQALYVSTFDQMIHQVGDRLTHPRTLYLDLHGVPTGHSASMFDSFVRAIRGGVEPLVGLEDGLRVVEILTAVDDSLVSGQPARVPPPAAERE